MSNTIKFIRGAEASIPTLNQGEPAFTTDTHKVFIGDGAENHQLAMITDIAGEANTASNVGSQVEIFKQKAGVDLEFRTLKAASDKVTISTMGGIDIDIGSEAEDANGTTAEGWTYIDLNNPCNKAGKITTIEIFANTTLTNCEVATFYRPDPTNYPLKFTTRDNVTIESVTAGIKEIFVVSLDVEIGDFLGVFIDAGDGTLERNTVADEDLLAAPNDHIPCTNQTFSIYDYTSSISIKGYGTSATLDYINFDIDPTKIDDLDPTFEATLVKKTDTVNVLSDITSAGADIEDAVTKKHTQNTDTLLSIATALSSDHTYVGITDSKNVGENVVFGDLLYFNWTDTEWKKAKADAAATTPAMRIALESKSDGQACLMLVQGYIRDDSAFQFTAAIGYLSITTAGAVQYAVPSVAGNQVQRVGIGISTDILFFNPSCDVGEI